MKSLDETFIPVHEGLKMYLKDLGLWTPKHEKRDRKNLDLLQRYIDAYEKIVWQADDMRLDLIQENDKWVKLWEDYRNANLPPIKLWANLDEE